MVVKKRCPFCSIAHGSSPSILYKDENVVAFRDKNPSAFRHYLVVPVKHIPTIKHLRKGEEHYALVEHMVKTGKQLLERDASNAKEYRFGFHRPPFNSINHLHLHCLALPFSPWWRKFKYSSYGNWGGYVEANQVLHRLNPK